ncbi:hypothetical protein HQ544_02615 [Candidatus Falkowbacteria bacterium]|nr:hypothetical protein [Candidatus Falkowbacteria bacterium]
MSSINKQPSQEERDLIIARLEVLSPELHFASGGNFQDFSRKDMIKQIKDNTKVGREFVATEFEFLRAIGDGSLMKVLNTSD